MHPSLSKDQAMAVLALTPSYLREAVRAIPEAMLTWHPASGEWCVNEMLGHLIEAERHALGGRMRTMLATEEPPLPSWDQNEAARARNDCARDAHALLDEFAALRAQSLAMVRGLEDTDLRRGGNHPQIGYIRVGELLHEWVYHDQAHLQQIAATLQQYVWPQLGNMQKFYT